MKAHDILIIRSGGRVSGTIRYGKIVVESGGEVSGDTKNISDDNDGFVKKKSPKQSE